MKEADAKEIRIEGKVKNVIFVIHHPINSYVGRPPPTTLKS